MNLKEFHNLALSRRAVRRFGPEPVPRELLLELLDCARWAPSGFNLQPTHYVIVQDPNLKEKLLKACMQQRQVVDAPTVIVFTGDRQVVKNNLENVIEESHFTEAGEARFRRYVHLNFGNGLFGIEWLVKFIATPFLRLFTPMPTLPAVHKRYWLGKQVMLSAMNFMLAAEAAKLVTSPIEGFDEWRVRRILGIPLTQIVPIIIAVGHPVAHDLPLSKCRLPLEDSVHFNRW
ncbi:MAG: nitroreductase family protein [Chlamydiia bacterium]|nr:nitroreductase family protein [Chlamydiia bacterium]